VRALYNALVVIALVLALPGLLLWIAISPRARKGLAQRLRSVHGPRIDVWAHAASVGEAESLVPLVEALSAQGLRIFMTTQTVAGRTTLRRRLPGIRARLAPLDLSLLTESSIRRVAPRILLLVETELWPNLIWSARRAGSAIVVVGARISDRSFPRYRRLSRFFRGLLREIDVIGARGRQDAERFVELGAPRERVVVVGDLKLDRPAPDDPSEELRQAVGPGPLFVAGSTHPGEEEILLPAWAKLRARVAPDLRLVLAPRHVDRAPALLRLAKERGHRASLRTKGAASADVVVLDTVGELASLYSIADLVFCGGSLVPVGGHNLLEPVQVGRVVLHGPHVENQRAQVELLTPLGVLRRVRDGQEVEDVGSALLTDRLAHGAAEAAIGALTLHRGAVQRSAEIVLDVLRREAANV
jgi:3-deoxy-D-manno-octulosonic-acid transferase